MEEFKLFTHDRSRSIGIVSPEGSWVCELSKDNHYYEPSEVEQHAKLICQSLNVFTRTGLTPEQMEKEMQSLKSDCEINSESFRNQLKESNIELAKMEARLKEAVAVISKVNDWLYKGDESEYSNESLMDLTDEYLTKEKTK